MSESAEVQENLYLAFELDGEELGIDISRVREVLDYTKPAAVPRMPGFMRGVINLRGSAVPVVDLRRKLGMGSTEKTVDTRIIIGEIEVDGKRTMLGTLADAVHEVMEMDPSQIDPVPSVGVRLNTDFLKGIGKYGEEFIMILDLDRVFSVSELTQAAG